MSTSWTDFGKAAKSVLTTLAPTVATAFGGPLAGMAVASLEKAFGTDPKATDQLIASANPDTLVKLKQIETEFTAQMAQLGVTEDQLRYADVANARGREVAVRDWTPRVIAYCILTLALGGELGLAWLLLHGHTIADANTATIVGRILGTLDSAAVMVLGYYYGSSSGSAAKSATIEKLATQ